MLMPYICGNSCRPPLYTDVESPSLDCQERGDRIVLALQKEHLYVYMLACGRIQQSRASRYSFRRTLATLLTEAGASVGSAPRLTEQSEDGTTVDTYLRCESCGLQELRGHSSAKEELVWALGARRTSG